MATENTLDMVNSDHKNILDFIKSEGPLTTDNALVNQIFDHAFMLTQYEKNGCISDTDFYFYLASECEPVTFEQINAYYELNNDYDSCIYDMQDFNEIMQGFSPERIAFMIHHGNFNPYDDYFSFDGYGNLRSIDHYQFRNEIYNGDEIKAALIENNKLESFPETDVSMIMETLEYKNIIIDTALYMVSLGY